MAATAPAAEPGARAWALRATGMFGWFGLATITCSNGNRLPGDVLIHWPPFSGVLETFFWAIGGRSLSWPLAQETWPRIVSMLVCWMASTIAWGSPTPARCSALMATSNRAWTDPIGWVHCRWVCLVYSAAHWAEVSPVSEDLNGQVGCHETVPVSPAGDGWSTSR